MFDVEVTGEVGKVVTATFTGKGVRLTGCLLLALSDGGEQLFQPGPGCS